MAAAMLCAIEMCIRDSFWMPQPMTCVTVMPVTPRSFRAVLSWSNLASFAMMDTLCIPCLLYTSHSMEVAWVAGLLAGEMGVNVTMARRAGCLLYTSRCV